MFILRGRKREEERIDARMYIFGASIERSPLRAQRVICALGMYWYDAGL